MPAKKVIVVRHGRYKGDRLVAAGEQEMHALAERIHPELEGQTVVILCLDVPYIRQSAGILADRLVWDDSYYEPSAEVAFEKLKALCQATTATVVIVVTRKDEVAGLMRDLMGLAGVFELPSGSDYGRGYIFDARRRDYSSA